MEHLMERWIARSTLLMLPPEGCQFQGTSLSDCFAFQINEIAVHEIVSVVLIVNEQR